MVAMNPQTWDQDLRRDRAGRLPVLRLHQAAAAGEVPRRHHRHRHAADRDLQPPYTDPRQRQLFKNIIYVGALAALLGIEPEAIAELIGEQYKGKEALIKPNVEALDMGRTYAQNELDWPLGLKVRRADAVGEKHLHRGQQRRGAGLRLRRGHGLRRGIRSPPRPRSPKRSPRIAASSAPIRRPARRATRSSRPRTRSPRSASSSAPAGTVRARSPALPGRASR